jgi:hypothetical protein
MNNSSTIVVGIDFEMLSVTYKSLIFFKQIYYESYHKIDSAVKWVKLFQMHESQSKFIYFIWSACDFKALNFLIQFFLFDVSEMK